MKYYLKKFLTYQLSTTECFYTREWVSEWIESVGKYKTYQKVNRTKLGEFVENKPSILYWFTFSAIFLMINVGYVLYFPFYLIYLLFRKKDPFE